MTRRAGAATLLRDPAAQVVLGCCTLVSRAAYLASSLLTPYPRILNNLSACM
jgi:hypothetical protein